jgi:hypothetical protein
MIGFLSEEIVDSNAQMLFENLFEDFFEIVDRISASRNEFEVESKKERGKHRSQFPWPSFGTKEPWISSAQLSSNVFSEAEELKTWSKDQENTPTSWPFCSSW